jgi:(E)-4-hydroxy-3-methylbut-2-enyl-diphosphate synthase
MIETLKSYCNSLTKYGRWKTRVVNIGDIPCGGDSPIRIQSMTTTNTMDTTATVEQTIRMVNAGCEYVRITAPSKLEAQNLENIKKELRGRGYNVPLVADIHFTPNAAELAARIVEKVRINPGNYADRKKFEMIEYTDSAYNAELERIRGKFIPLVKICKEYGTAMRIGTNHGSLSDRIMSRFGDTPFGMVESALEFVRICEELDYHNIVLSMKSSNPQVMVQAYRLLVSKMIEEEMNYPLHLGVTEAGGGEDGRVKSAVGIGTLLEDGLGDTIRVSLTEDPEFEAPVAIYLANRYKNRSNHGDIEPINTIPYDFFSYSRRITNQVLSIGGNNVPIVVSDLSELKSVGYEELKDIGYSYDHHTDKWTTSDAAADFLYLKDKDLLFNCPNMLKIIKDYSHWKQSSMNKSYPLFTPEEFLSADSISEEANFIKIKISDLNSSFIDAIKTSVAPIILIIETGNDHGMGEQRRLLCKLMENDLKVPVIVKRDYDKLNLDELRLFSSTDLGGLLVDGFGDGVWITTTLVPENRSSNNYIKKFRKEDENLPKVINRLLFGILQAARVRISKTEYIACPSCGRTLFDLQETTDMIRKQTEHLKGVKIAIMGCIVNGPGEMADADYGYVGSGVGKITLYKGKEVVKRNINADNAVEALIDIIKDDGVWIEPVK